MGEQSLVAHCWFAQFCATKVNLPAALFPLGIKAPFLWISKNWTPVNLVLTCLPKSKNSCCCSGRAAQGPPDTYCAQLLFWAQKKLLLLFQSCCKYIWTAIYCLITAKAFYAFGFWSGRPLFLPFKYRKHPGLPVFHVPFVSGLKNQKLEVELKFLTVWPSANADVF